MSLTLIYLLLFLLIAAAFMYLYFIRHRPREDRGRWATASLVVLVGLLIPFTAWSLFEQAAAKGRLENLGLALYPGIGSSVGLATGGPLSDDTWVFRLDDGNEPAFVEFYEQADNTSSWTPVSDSPGLIILTSGNRQLLVTARKDTGIFILSTGVNQ